MSRSLLSVSLCGLLALGTGSRADEPEKTPSPLSLLRALDEGFVQVYQKVAPAVVVIEATKRIDEAPAEEEPVEPFPDESKEGHGKAPHHEAKSWRGPQTPRSEGSGFIIRPDGYIVTNLHVIAEAEKFSVRLKDGRIFPGKIVGTDDNTDIAVIKIEAKDLPVAEMGDSDALRVGQLVCAIGIPFRQDYSFTVGWVSGKGRTNLLSPSSPPILYEDYIQTDAFINPGNSGGPLFDVEGKVMGMNTLINGIGRGLAFAIPSNIVRSVSEQLINTGRVIRPWLGIRIETLGLDDALRDRVGGLEDGVVVETIEANAPAFHSELRPADIITAIDEVKIATALDLQKEVLKKQVGDVLHLTVWRSGQMMMIPVMTGELPGEFTKNDLAAPRVTPLTAVEPHDEDFGLRLRDSGGGAQVSEVLPRSAAALADLQPEDVIVEVENQPVNGAESCLTAIRSAAEKAGPRGVQLSIDRRGKRTYETLHVGG